MKPQNILIGVLWFFEFCQCILKGLMMLNQYARTRFDSYPVIAAVRTVDDFTAALSSKVRVIFMVGGDVFKVKKQIVEANDNGILVFFHMDLIEGIGRDGSGISFAKEELGISGVQSTKPHILKLAKQEKLITVHRLFVTDFQSLESGINMVKISKPDFVELTPGILPRIIKKIKSEYNFRIISSGLISNKNDIKVLHASGAQNVVCSTRDLWDF